MSWFSSNNLNNKFNYDFYNSISNFKSNNNKNNKKFNSVRNSNNNLNFILKHTKKNSIFNNFNSTNNKKLDSNHFLTIYNVRNKNLESRNKKSLIIKQPTTTILPTIKIENNNENKNYSIKKLPFIKIKSTTNRENKKFLLFNNNNNKTNENKHKFEKTKKIRILKFNKNKKTFFSSFDTISLPGTKNNIPKINQDSFLTITNINNNKNIKIFGVFDGHGENGLEISKFVSNYFTNYYENFYQNSYSSTSDSIKNSYSNLDETLKKLHNENKIDIFRSGTTSNITIIENTKIFCSNLGDSRSILIDKYNNIHTLSIDDTPEIPIEKERILNLGGEVSRVEWCDYGPFRVWFKDKNYPGLAMSRSLGDLEAEKIGVISEPKIVEFNCENVDVKFIVVATDGIWEFLSNEKVKNIILPFYNCDDVKGANKKLVEIAKKFWEVNNKMGVDDITSIIIFYK